MDVSALTPGPAIALGISILARVGTSYIPDKKRNTPASECTLCTYNTQSVTALQFNTAYSDLQNHENLATPKIVHSSMLHVT